MPYVTTERLAATTKLLENGTFDMKMLALRQRPINPPNGDTSMAMKQLAGGVQPRSSKWTKLKIEKVEDMAGFIRLEPGDGVYTGSMTFIVKLASELKDANSRAGWIPCWFLPWESEHLVKLKILSNETHPVLNFGQGIAPMANPGLFFTAGINGCSVFAVGDPKAPSIYHAGIQPLTDVKLPLGPNETTEQGWQRFLGRSGVSKTGAIKNVRSVGKTDYISELQAGATSNDQRGTTQGGKESTVMSDRFESILKTRGALSCKQVVAWGAVFGLRDNGNVWHINLVKNGTVIYERVITTVKKRVFGKNTTTQANQGEIRTNTPFARGGDGQIDWAKVAVDQTGLNAMRELPIYQGVNLGYQEFFPGVGAAHYRDLNSIQVM